jgi:AraC family transcriptional regulator of adaptative response / DNA-3-methyladenine glycosylase II
MAALATRLGVSDRHLRRIFEAQLGVSPLQYLQTRRLLTAKQLLADTDLPVPDVAYASGFASVRRFNAAFALHYGMPPTALRKAGADSPKHGAGIVVRLGYRPPYDVAAMLAFLAKRALNTIELIANNSYYSGAIRTFYVESEGKTHVGWVEATFDEARCHMVLRIAPSLREVLPLVIHRVRAWLDVDADPAPINALLLRDFPGTEGLRVPGCMDGYELAVRAVLGQQITVAAARTLSQRLLDRFGTPISTPWPELTRLFPTPAVLARAGGDALGQLGIVKTRQAAIVAIAQAVDAGRIVLHGGAEVSATVAALKALPGIGDWTAQYIAMRALRWPDAFPAGDVALHKALRVQDKTQSATRVARAAEAASQAWKPWRSYAVVRAWHGLG